MTDPRSKSQVETTIFVSPGETAPPTLVVLPNGKTIDYASIESMESDDFEAWYENMTSGDPADIE